MKSFMVQFGIVKYFEDPGHYPIGELVSKKRFVHFYDGKNKIKQAVNCS